MLKKGPFFEELPGTSKKLVSVSTTSVSVTDGSKEVIRVPCINYPVQFQEEQVRALLNSGSEINAINPAYAERLNLKTWKINVGVQKIDGSALEMFGMVITDF